MSLAVAPTRSAVLIGWESVGKSQLAASLSGRWAEPSNFAGSTVECESYPFGEWTIVDAPGLQFAADAETTAITLRELQEHDVAVLVVSARNVIEELNDLLPLVEGRSVLVIATFWDRVPPPEQAAVRSELSNAGEALRVPVLFVNARTLTESDRVAFSAALDAPGVPVATRLTRSALPVVNPGIVTPKPLRSVSRAAVAAVMLITPAAAAVYVANSVAALVDPMIVAARQPLVQAVTAWPESMAAARELLVGRFGFLTMAPLLFVWAMPTVVLYAVLLACFKASGLIDRITAALHPWVSLIGLSGRDLIRVVMGFGCNVPAVISTRACSRCSRGACVSAIAFGAVCSYQFPATLAVFAAIQQPWLVVPFLGYLLVTTMAYVRWTSTPASRQAAKTLLVSPSNSLQWPTIEAVIREAWSTLRQFAMQALPVFLLITLAASLLDQFGLLEWLARLIAPAMAVFHLPAEAALPVVLSSVRKDGILLFLNGSGELAAPLSAGQVLTGVYLAGTLLPCLVTAMTIAREQSTPFAMRLLFRQAMAAAVFASLLGWSCWSIGL
jgi:Fe2+ transport system protein B